MGAKQRRWTVTTAEIGGNDFGGQVFKRGRFYFARAWDHRNGYGPMMAMVARRTLAGAFSAVERWLNRPSPSPRSHGKGR